MEKILVYIIGLLIVLTTGCNKFLDTTPTDFLNPSEYYETQEQLKSALAGVYDVLGNNKLYGVELHTRHNSEADEGFWNASAQVTGRQVYNFTPGDPDIRVFWQALYMGVARANLLLASVDKNPSIDQVYRDQVRAEALFLRAYYYFILVQNFEDVPLLLTPIKNYEDVDVAATPAKQIYEQIIADMEAAEPHVKPLKDLGYGGRVSKSAVRGILARVCLNMAGEPVNDASKYERARFWAKKVIDDTESIHKLNPDYSDVFIKYAQDIYDVQESIWEVEFWGNSMEAFQESGYVGSWMGIQNTFANNDIGYSFGRIVVTGKHYRMYEAGDLRKDWNINTFVYRADGSKSYYAANPDPSEQYKRNASKYRREFENVKPKNTQLTPINFPLLRYADVLLMYAEAENEVSGSPTSEAYAAINQVRRRAFGHLMTGSTAPINEHDLATGMNKYSFFKAIVDERSRELCFEALRKHDLIRWGIFIPTMKETLMHINSDLGPTAWQGLAYRNVSAKHVVYPIPSYELELNKKLVQHPFWR